MKAQLQHPTFQKWKTQTTLLSVFKTAPRGIRQPKAPHFSSSNARPSSNSQLSGKGISGSGQRERRQSSTSVEEEIRRDPQQPSGSSSTPKTYTPLTLKNIGAVFQDLLQKYNISGARNPQGPTGPPPPNTPEPPRPPGPPGPPGINAGPSKAKWIASDIGFFDPNFEGKSVQIAAEIEHTSRDTYFCVVHTIIQRAKDLIPAKGEQTIRDNLYACFRGIALQWFASELSTDRKILVFLNISKPKYFKYGPGIEHWERQLLKRFKMAPSLAMAIVMSEKYTMEDARHRREPKEYSSKILRACRDVEMTTYLALTTVIYNGFHPQFKRDLPFPSATTSVETFLQAMDDCKIVWWELASKDEVQGYSQGSSAQRPEKRRGFYPSRSTEWRLQRGGTQNSQLRNERNRFQEGYRGYYQPEDYRRPYMHRSPEEFQQRPVNNQYHQRRQPVAPLPRPKLQIAATSSAGSSKEKQLWTKPSILQ